MTGKISRASQKPRLRRYAYTWPEMQLIKALQDAGLRFTTQEPFYVEGLEKPFFMVDILVEGKLVVEVQGPKHLKPRVRLRDEEKRRALESKGYTVLYFSTVEVKEDLDEVVARIKKELKDIL